MPLRCAWLRASKRRLKVRSLSPLFSPFLEKGVTLQKIICQGYEENGKGDFVGLDPDLACIK